MLIISTRFSTALFAAATLSFLACSSSDTSGGSSGGGAAATSLCQAAGDSVTAQTARLSCPSDGGFKAQCDAAFATKPQCADVINAFLQCGLDAPDSDWECDGDGATNLKASACPTQQGAVDTCLK